MLYIERWKANLVILICLFGIVYSLPNLLSKSTLTWMQENLPSFVPTQTVSLGLDLQGGSHLLLEVVMKTALEEQMQSLMDQLRSDLRKEKIGYTDLSVRDGVVTFKLTDSGTQDKANEIVRNIDRDMDLSVDNGIFSMKLSEKQIADRQRQIMDQSIEIVRRRIDETGTREPSIQKQGDNRILVQLPGLDDPGRIKKLLGQTAKLTFHLVDEDAMNDNSGRVPMGSERLPSTEGNRSYIIQKRVMLAGDTLIDAKPSFHSQGGEPVVTFKFNAQGSRRFGEITRANVNRAFAIVLDNKVITAPVIREPITGGSGEISGNFTSESASDLALLLRAGALPAPIEVIEERTIGPGLGADSIKAGAYASVLGLALVMVGTIICYGFFGIIADIALLFNMALIFAALSFLQATLTLPGIAGIVLTIGMAVDANVLIFERVREERRLGRGVIPALDAGYKRALSSIMDANITTLIAAFLLFMFGAGTIKGFAVTLSIGIITSIFSAVMVSHLMIVWWTQIKKPKELPI